MNRPMRFCMITTFYPPYNFGGDGIFVYHLSHALARRGHHVEVIHCTDSYRVLGGRASKDSTTDHPNLIVHGLKSPFGPLSPLATQQTGYPLFKAARVREILDKGFDVIHYHNTSLVGGPGITRLGEGIKLYTMHEYWLICPTHVLFRFNRSVCTRRYCLLCSLSHGRPPQWWRHLGFLKRMEKNVDVFIAPSRFCRQKHHQMGFTAPIVHLHNLVPLPDKSVSSPVQDNTRKTGRPYFLFVGRLEKIKGLQTIIPFFRRYSKAELWIVGKGKYERRLKRLAGGDNNIRFLGYRQGQALHSLYEGAVAVIVPSLCLEIASSVIPEAFMHRTPVIARRLAGMQEIVEESGGGFLFDTEEEFMGAVSSLVEDPSCRNQRGEDGYQAYLRDWTEEVHLKRYFALIEDVADKTEKGKTCL